MQSPGKDICFTLRMSKTAVALEREPQTLLPGDSSQEPVLFGLGDDLLHVTL